MPDIVEAFMDELRRALAKAPQTLDARRKRTSLSWAYDNMPEDVQDVLRNTPARYADVFTPYDREHRPRFSKTHLTISLELCKRLPTLAPKLRTQMVNPEAGKKIVPVGVGGYFNLWPDETEEEAEAEEESETEEEAETDVSEAEDGPIAVDDDSDVDDNVSPPLQCKRPREDYEACNFKACDDRDGCEKPEDEDVHHPAVASASSSASSSASATASTTVKRHDQEAPAPAAEKRVRVEDPLMRFRVAEDTPLLCMDASTGRVTLDGWVRKETNLVNDRVNFPLNEYLCTMPIYTAANITSLPNALRTCDFAIVQDRPLSARTNLAEYVDTIKKSIPLSLSPTCFLMHTSVSHIFRGWGVDKLSEFRQLRARLAAPSNHVNQALTQYYGVPGPLTVTTTGMTHPFVCTMDDLEPTASGNRGRIRPTFFTQRDEVILGQTNASPITAASAMEKPDLTLGLALSATEGGGLTLMGTRGPGGTASSLLSAHGVPVVLEFENLYAGSSILFQDSVPHSGRVRALDYRAANCAVMVEWCAHPNGEPQADIETFYENGGVCGGRSGTCLPRVTAPEIQHAETRFATHFAPRFFIGTAEDDQSETEEA